MALDFHLSLIEHLSFFPYDIQRPYSCGTAFPHVFYSGMDGVLCDRSRLGQRCAAFPVRTDRVFCDDELHHTPSEGRFCGDMLSGSYPSIFLLQIQYGPASSDQRRKHDPADRELDRGDLRSDLSGALVHNGLHEYGKEADQLQ